MTTRTEDRCAECTKYALVVVAVSEDLLEWVLECAECGTVETRGELTK